MSHQSGIYEIVNTVNGKRYIGSAVNFKRRWSKHVSLLRLAKHHSPHLQKSWNKYGEAAFQFRVILVCRPEKDILLMYENQCFTALKPAYNAYPVAGSPQWSKHTIEARAKMSALLIGHKRHTPESRASIANANSGRVVSQETRNKIAAASRGNCFRRGKVLSVEVKKKIAAAHTGLIYGPMPQEQRDKIAAQMRGKKRPPRSKEWQDKLNAARKASYAKKKENQAC